MDTKVVYLLGRLAKIMPPMGDEEYGALKESIRSQGLLEEITLWRGTVIDGLHRLRACLELGVEPRFGAIPDDADPLQHVLGRNGARRHMNGSARAAAAYLASETARPGRPAGTGENDAKLHRFLTRREAARALGVSVRSVATVARVLAPESGAVPGLRRAVLTGRIKASDAARVAGEPEEVQQRALDMMAGRSSGTITRAVAAVKQGIADGEHAGATESPATAEPGGSVTLHVSSVAELRDLVGENTVDAIITFPPADAASGTMLADLAAFAAHSLRSTGGMFVLTGTGPLPQFLQELRHPGLSWVCALSYRRPGRTSRLGPQHQISLRHMLLLVYGKSQFRLGAGEDSIDVPALSGNDPGNRFSPRLDLGMEMIVRRFARPGQVVCDPILLNRHETALAAVMQGCSFVGAWQDAAGIERVRARFAREGGGSVPGGFDSTART